MMRLGLACWQRLLGSLLVLGLVLGVGIEDARADLSWTCTHWAGSYSAHYTDYGTSGPTSELPPSITGGTFGAATAYCSNATISGTIDASITAADRTAIINGVTGSAILTNITNKVDQTATNTMYSKGGNNWSAARWAAEGYTLSSSILTDTTAIKTQIQDIKVAVESNPPFIHSLKGKNNATATSNGTFTVIVEAQNAVQYRGKYDNSIWTDWTSSKEVVITGMPEGLRTITIEAENSKNETYSKEMTVFSL